jgi:hypothetical protein
VARDAGRGARVAGGGRRDDSRVSSRAQRGICSSLSSSAPPCHPLHLPVILCTSLSSRAKRGICTSAVPHPGEIACEQQAADTADNSQRPLMLRSAPRPTLTKRLNLGESLGKMSGVAAVHSHWSNRARARLTTCPIPTDPTSSPAVRLPQQALDETSACT